MKIFKVVLLLLATMLMSAVILGIQNSSIVDTISGTYVVIISTFLGVDMASMIKDSTKMKPGSHKDIKLYRYILAFICMVFLFSIALYMKESRSVESILAISAFGSGAMLIIGLVMGGLEGNKIASRGGPDDTSINN